MARFETLATDAIERMALLLGLTIDLDDPEACLIASVERKVAELLARDDPVERKAKRIKKTGESE